MSIISHALISGNDKENVFKAVERALKLSNYKLHIKGPEVFIKINLMSHQVIPGVCTSPWVTEAIISKLHNDGFGIFVGDADVATIKQANIAAKNWGVLDICNRYDAKFVNLSEQKTITIKLDNAKILKKLQIPKILKEVNSIVSVPVLKTHNVTWLTCALKHQWSCIPNFRHQFHALTDYVIPEINKAVDVSFVVTDATICLEGNGPRVGIPKIVNSIFASNDLVAMDKAMCDFIGMDYKKVTYIESAEKYGIGKIKYKFIGDRVIRQKFLQPKLSEHPIVYTEMKLRKIPLINYIIFKTPFFKIPAWIATKYNTVWYHNTKGKKYARAILKNDLYRKEFLSLIK
ncbi:DUF362 domain-containing protein [Candidatus Woesearchaeota archaeon]|nr:DUF362 domain-containing protein [Candidatus Woesearchaeota archaeon]